MKNDHVWSVKISKKIKDKKKSSKEYIYNFLINSQILFYVDFSLLKNLKNNKKLHLGKNK